MPSTPYQKIWKVVEKIPYGKVASYGQVAQLAGMEGKARLAGYALHALPDSKAVPWHRVINAKGRISLPGPLGRRQRFLLEKEGVKTNAAGKIDFQKYGWIQPRISTPRI